MLLKKFRATILEGLLAFLWKEWSTLGVPGVSEKDEKWILDPEALVAFSLPLARYEPRLFDEILAWQLINGHWLDTVRLRNILQASHIEVLQAAGAVLNYCDHHDGERKWKSLAEFCLGILKKQPERNSTAPLFFEKSGRPHSPALKNKSAPEFLHFRLNRPEIKNLKESQAVPINAETNIRFQLRALLGVGGRSEIILYLLSHEGGRARDIADGIGLFWLGVQQTLKDLAASDLIHTRKKGNKVEYWLSQKKWWEFLTPSISETHFNPKPQWVDWVTIFSAILTMWQTIDQLSKNDNSEYIVLSKQQDCLELMAKNFMKAGLDVPPHPKNTSSIDHQQKAMLEYLEKIFGTVQSARKISPT